MLKYAVVPLLLLTLTSCVGGKKAPKQDHLFMHADDSNMQAAEMGMNEYYGCPDSGPIAVVNFDFDKSTLSSEAHSVLKEAYSKCIHEHLMNNPDSKLLITGHTDRHGTVEYNIALGSRRADAAHRALHGISSAHKSVSAPEDSVDSGDLQKTPDIKAHSCLTSKGKEEQAHGMHVADADAKNRRVVLEFVEKGHCE